jgi:hypothetical protein
MKRDLLFRALLLIAVVTGLSVNVSSQSIPPGAADTLFIEPFDVLPWKMTPLSTGPTALAPFYLETLITKDGSAGAATDTTGNRTKSYLETPQIAITGYNSVGISFDHICYIEQFDDAVIEYSFDNGANWARIPRVVNDNGNVLRVYTGQSLYDYGGGDFKFSKTSRAVEWKFAPSNDTAFIWTTASADPVWMNETFDITPLINTNGNPDSVRLRIGLLDDPASPVGRIGTHRWFVDNFIVRGADCELTPPVMDFLEPPRNYPARYEERVYSIGPYDFDAQITDQGGLVDTAYIVYSLRRNTATFPNPPSWVTLISLDTLPMLRRPGNNFEGQITRILNHAGGRDTVKVGDSIIWKVEAVDASDCKNKTQNPPQGFSRFRVYSNLPKSCNTQPVFEFPYYQDFEGSDFIPGRSGLLAEDWENISGDFHDWWVNQGPTPTDSTGPSSGYPAGGKYLYVESSKTGGVDSYKDSVAFLVTPCFDLADDVLPNGLVRFYLNMNTNSIFDSVNVDIFDPTPGPGYPFGRFIENIVPVITGFKGDNWIPIEFSTFPFRNTVTQIRFRGTPGTDQGKSDMALDSFKIVPAPLTDLRINEVLLAPYSPYPKPGEQVTVNVQNLGVSPATSIDISYQICNPTCGTVVGPYTWTGNLLPGQNEDITILDNAMEYTVPNKGLFSIRAWIDYTGDASPSNDTITGQSIGLLMNALSTKYRDEFDNDTLWISGSADDDTLFNKWELGTPSFDRTNSAISEPNSWDVLLNRQYTGTGTTTSLISPFMDFSGTDSVIMSFLNNRDIDLQKDGVWIDYSLNRGRRWDSLPSLHDLKRLKWYNDQLASGGLAGTPVFSGTTSCKAGTWGGWLESEIALPGFFNNKGEVLFRFNFYAENDEDGNDGMSIDNFILYDAKAIDIEPQFMLSPTSDCELTSVQRIESVIKNRGLTDVNGFKVEYQVRHIPTGNIEIKTDTINRLIETRDTLHVLSKSTFDMFLYGDYEVKIITKLDGMDMDRSSDTLTRLVERIEGCSLRFQIQTSFRPNAQLPCDSTSWVFNYTSGGRKYKVTRAYNDPDYPINMTPSAFGDTIRGLYVCIKHNSQVRFDLNDRDTLIENYSLIAFNGGNDTTILESVSGGPDSPTQFFDFFCPPVRSVSPQNIIVDNNKVQLPVSKNYPFESVVLNNGLDSITFFEARLQIDNLPPILRSVNIDPNRPLRYNQRYRVSFGNVKLEPGYHDLMVWTSLPNNQADLLPSDDTVRSSIVIMDTIKVDPYCDDFEDPNGIKWIALNPYTSSQANKVFERGTPSAPVINTASSGSNVWATNVDGKYGNTDSTALLSPWVLLKSDSCYKVSFKHNYYITDSLNDGGSFRVIRNSWGNDTIVGNSMGDTVALPNTGSNWFFTADQQGWFNTAHILSIPDNDQNSGWTGNSNGWQDAQVELAVTEDEYVSFVWRFESDGSIVSDGWAIDDFCVESVPATRCFPVGISEYGLNTASVLLGQNIPNPANGITSIPYYLPKSGQVHFMVTNMLGQPVYEQSMDRPSGNNLLDIDVSGMSKGIYYYIMDFEGHRITRKMIVLE